MIDAHVVGDWLKQFPHLHIFFHTLMNLKRFLEFFKCFI